MSIKKAKESCGYEAKPFRQQCGNCGSFRSDFVIPEWAIRNTIDRSKFENGTFAKQEKNLRCAAYGFAVKKTALCKMWRK